MPAPSDLVHQITLGTGTGTVTLVAVNGKRSFNSAFGTGGTNVFDYFISSRDAAEWERGTGHLSDATTLVRDTVLASSNSGSAVNFSSGTKDITNDVPATNQARLDTSQTWSGTNTFSAALNLTSGQITFPASQNASAGANTLDDYEEGTWTPVLTAATAGNLSVAYSTQLATYTKIGRAVFYDLNVLTSSFTYTTAIGLAKVNGLPFTAASAGADGAMDFQGVTKAGYTQFALLPSSTTLFIQACGSAQANATVAITEMPSGGTVFIEGGGWYRV